MPMSSFAWRILDDVEGNTVQEGGKADSGVCYNTIKGRIFEIDDCIQGNFFKGRQCTGFFTAVFNKQPQYTIPSDALSFRVYC